jgi:hypothetical protein
MALFAPAELEREGARAIVSSSGLLVVPRRSRPTVVSNEKIGGCGVVVVWFDYRCKVGIGFEPIQLGAQGLLLRGRLRPKGGYD